MLFVLPRLVRIRGSQYFHIVLLASELYGVPTLEVTLPELISFVFRSAALSLLLTSFKQAKIFFEIKVFTSPIPENKRFQLFCSFYSFRAETQVY